MRWFVLALLVACGGSPPEPADSGWADVGAFDAGALDVGDSGGPTDTTGGAGDTTAPDGPKLLRIDVKVGAKAWDHLHADPNGTDEIEVELTVGGQTFPGTEMELHGGFARTVPKKSYRFSIDDDFGSELDLFGDGVERQRRFVLKASWNDRTWMRGPLTMDLLREAGGLAPRERHAELYVNGGYFGLYVLVERIDKLYLKRQGLEKDKASLYKAENHNANWKPKADPLAGYDQELGKEGDVGDLAALLDACGKTETTAEAFAAKVEPWLSLEDFVRWQRVNTYADNKDTYTKNYLLHHDRAASYGAPTHPFRLIAWDADATWGNNWDGEPLEPDAGAWHGTDGFSPRLFSIPAWRSSYLAAYEDALAGPFRPDAIGERISALTFKLRAAAMKDLAKWQPGFSFDAEIARLRWAVEQRHERMSAVIGALK
ncbi:MAG: hypothetical protein AMXMBFR64_12830 [Myxococcales bacterium]